MRKIETSRVIVVIVVEGKARETVSSSMLHQRVQQKKKSFLVHRLNLLVVYKILNAFSQYQTSYNLLFSKGKTA